MSVDIAWGMADRNAWERAYSAAPRSNILQCWAYGEAKARVDGFEVQRGFVYRHGKMIATVQALERSIAGLARIVRINRGPLWMEPPHQEAIAEALAALRSNARWWRGRVLLIAPELPATSEATIRDNGYRRRDAPPWRSAWIDLTRPLPLLRANLQGKWRNMLSAAEHQGLQIVASSDDGEFLWLMDRYQELMAEKKFRGPDPKLLAALRAAAPSPGDALVLCAHHAGERVAGLFLFRHGRAATYVVGWTGAAGRRLRANNLLLWTAITALTERGVHDFDLGGIDDALTPGVAAFKRGMGGTEYALAGEFVSY
jgi:hypothetical protein